MKIGVDIEGLTTSKELKKYAVSNGYKTVSNLLRDLIKKFLQKQSEGLNK